jgi:hypothetical protein
MKTFSCIIIIAAIYSIIIGGIYVALGVLAILVRQCIMKMEGDPFLHMMYLSYFRESSCQKQVNWAELGVTGENIPQPIFPNETRAVSDTFIFSVVYVSLHGALILTAIYALFGIKGSCLSKWLNYIVYFVPWIVVSVAILALDVTATTYYMIDSIRNQNAGEFLTFLEVENRQEMLPYFEKVPEYLYMLPAVIMFLGSSKGFILLLLNLVIILAISSAGWKASNYTSYIDDSNEYENKTKTNYGFDDHESNNSTGTAPTADEMVYVGRTGSSMYEDRPQELQQTAERYQDQTKQPLPYIAPKYNQPNRSQSQSPALNPKYTGIRRDYQQRDIEDRLSTYQQSNGDTTVPVNIVKDTSKKLSESMYPIVAVQVNRDSTSRHKPNIPPKPMNRNSMQPYGGIQRSESYNSNRSSGRATKPPEELRGQLPWSYFKTSREAPKKAFTHVMENEETPHVPDPDYHQYASRPKHLNVGNDDEGVWSGQERRY